jgi:hypothetical protein
MSNFWIWIYAGKVLTRIYFLNCGKLNARSSILNFTLKITTLNFFDSGNLMVLSVNKFGLLRKIFLLFHM